MIHRKPYLPAQHATADSHNRLQQDAGPRKSRRLRSDNQDEKRDVAGWKK